MVYTGGGGGLDVHRNPHGVDLQQYPALPLEGGGAPAEPDSCYRPTCDSIAGTWPIVFPSSEPSIVN